MDNQAVLGWIELVAIAIAALIFLHYLIGLYNTLVRLRNNVQVAWNRCQLVLAQLHREVPKLQSVLAGHVGFERQIVREVGEARTAGLVALMEAFPNLKADDTFQNLIQRITALESQLQDSRQSYAELVNAYNTRIQQIPAVLLAWLMGFRSRALLDVASAGELAAADRERIGAGEGFLGVGTHTPAIIETNAPQVLGNSVRRPSSSASAGSGGQRVLVVRGPSVCPNPACGAPNTSAAKFCKRCGAKMAI